MAKSTPSAHITSKSVIPMAISAWEMYLLDQGRSPNTVKAFLSDVRLLDQYLPEGRMIGQVTTEDLNQFLTWMEKERDVPCSPKTLSRRITSIKSFFRWLHQHGTIHPDPAEKVLQRSALSPLPQVLTEEEFQAVLLAADRHRREKKADARPYTLLLLLLSTGIKKSECLGIHLNHIDQNSKGGPLVFIKYASSANRYKERKLVLDGDWTEAFNEYVAQYQPVDQLFPWSQRRLEYILEDIGDQGNS